MITQKLKDRAAALAAALVDITGCDFSGRSRKRPAPSLRMMLAVRLLGEGHTLEEVGEAVGRNHSTIIHYKRRFESLRFPGNELDAEIWDEFIRR